MNFAKVVYCCLCLIALVLGLYLWINDFGVFLWSAVIAMLLNDGLYRYGLYRIGVKIVCVVLIVIVECGGLYALQKHKANHATQGSWQQYGAL